MVHNHINTYYWSKHMTWPRPKSGRGELKLSIWDSGLMKLKVVGVHNTITAVIFNSVRKDIKHAMPD